MLGILTERERINEERRKRGEPPLTRGEYRHLKAMHAADNEAPQTFYEYAVKFATSGRAA